MSYFDTFYSLVLHNITGFSFNDIYKTTLVNQCRTTALNVEQLNILSLVTAMKDLREQFPEIMYEASNRSQLFQSTKLIYF